MMCNDCRAKDQRNRRRGKAGNSYRFTLKKHPAQYKREPKCPRCKSGNVRSVEELRRREAAKQQRCYCGAYPFPHRYGSLRFCKGHPRADEEPTEEELYDYEACLATPRSG